MVTIKKTNKQKKPKRKPPDKHRASLLHDKRFRNWLYIYCGLIVASGIIAAVVASHYDPPLVDPFTTSQHSSTKFQLYYPKRLPAGLHIDDASLVGDDSQIVAMRITDGKGKDNNFLLNQQSIPPNFNFETFYSSFGDRHDIKTQHGTAVIGTIDDGRTRLASLPTKDNTWILIQAPASVKVDDITQVLENLAPSK